MSGWMIVVDRLADLPAAVAGYPAMTARDYIMQPRATRRAVPKILNLSRSYGYQTLGYYCSLLAEARGHKVVPTVTTVLELTRRSSYVYALAELEDTLNRTIRRLADPPTASFRLLVCLGHADDPRFARFARQLFDWFRCPILEVFVKAGDSWRVRKLAPVAITELGEAGKAQLGDRDRGPCPPALEVAEGQGGAALHAGASCSTPRSSCRPRTCRRSATSSGSPRRWAWASR